MMLRSLLTIGALQVLTMLVMLVRTKVLSYVLGPEVYGAMGVIDKLVAVIVQTVTLSLPFAALRFLPAQWTAGRHEYRALFVRMLAVLSVIIGVTTALSLVANVFRPGLSGATLVPYSDAVMAALIGMPAVALVPFLQSAIAGRMQQYRAMIVSLLNACALSVACIAALSYGLRGYYLASALLCAVVAVAGIRMALQGTHAASPDTPPPAHQPMRFPFLPREILRFSGALLVLTFIAPYAALYVHYGVLGDHGALEAGWMSAAIGIGLAVRGVLGSAHSVFLTPNVNRGGAPADRMVWADQFQMVFCIIAGVSVPVVLMFPELFVRLLYNSEFSPGAMFVVLFVVTEILTMLSGTYQSLVVALSRMSFHVASNLTAQLLVIGAASLLIGPMGIAGAGLALMAAPLFLFISTMVFLAREYGLTMPRGVVIRSAWLVAGMATAGFIGRAYPALTSAGLPLKVLVYVIIVTGFGMLLTEDERKRGRAMIATMRARMRAAPSR